MIIKITVNDNDFRCKIMGFMKSMWNFWEDKTLSVSEQIEAHRKYFGIMNLINSNNDKPLTDKEKNLIKEYLKEKFYKYMKSNCQPDTAKYLVENLEIKFLKTFTDRWENDEAFYWLQHSNTIINQ